MEDFRRKELDRLLTLKHPHVNPLVMWSETEEEYRLVFEDFAGGEIAVCGPLFFEDCSTWSIVGDYCLGFGGGYGVQAM